MWRMITFPFRMLGGLAVLGVAYLLFALGCILLFAFFSSKPPVRYFETTAEVVRVRDFCNAIKQGEYNKFSVGSGFCDQLEQKMTSEPQRFDSASLRREPLIYVRYRDELGRELTSDARATYFKIPVDVKVGHRFPLKIKTKTRTWQQWRSDWYDSLPIFGLMIVSLLASAVLWTWGGGWRLMTRINHRDNRVTVAKFKLAILAAGFIAWVLSWAWRRVEHSRFGKMATRVHRDAWRP